jgi:hypothetical protein
MHESTITTLGRNSRYLFRFVEHYVGGHGPL